ncbi:MAG: gamma-glutamyltransferase [Thermomicrobiales bacterium]|nr:gamma-glutamyltransferase [Thermomicrobiales bacterium]
MIGFSDELTAPTPMALRRRGAPVFATGGLVASAHPLVSSSMLTTLAAGGNAVDAAIAGALTAGVVLPAMTGLGGDLFALVASPSDPEPVAVLSSGISPRGASLDDMRAHAEGDGRLLPQHGPLSPSVPGFVAGMFALHERYGTRPMTELAAPAIRYAADGFPVSPMVARWFPMREELLRRFPCSAAVFLPNGQRPRVGTVLKQPDLARSLAAIAKGGNDVFYRGEIARQIGAYLTANGGAMTAEDFADHEATVTAPLSTTYRGHTVYQTGLPTQGFVNLEALNIIANDDMGTLGVDRAPGIHLMAEALKLSFADRLAYAGDPTVVDAPLDRLLSVDWAASRREQIDPTRANPNVQPGILKPGDTTYLCVIDGDGLMVSLICSISDAFGSGVVAGETGIVLNNRAGHCFSLEEGSPNCYAPGKKPMHTLNCFLVSDEHGTPVMVGGTPGGDGQPQWNLQMLTGLLDAGLDVQEAAELPRWAVWPATYPAELGNPVELRVEAQTDQATIDALAELGHTVNVVPAWSMISGAQLIARDPERHVLVDGSDPRVEGMAEGI